MFEESCSQGRGDGTEMDEFWGGGQRLFRFFLKVHLFWYSHSSLNVDAQLAAFAFAVLFRTKWTSNICHSNVSLHHFRRILQRHQTIFPVQRTASRTEDLSKAQHDMRKVKVCE